MKKNIFIILISTLFVLMLLYFYDRKEAVLNREYINEKENVYVEYPYFNDSYLDNYLNEYLNGYIQDKRDIHQFLFIDYDYELFQGMLELTMYIYMENGGLVEEEARKFELDLQNHLVTASKRVMQTGLSYDGYRQNMIDLEKPMVALTFDDGPNHNTVKVLDILEHYGVKATFFLLGCNVTGNEKTIQRMNQLGMEIGNHMYSHKLITRLSNDKIQSEVKKVDDLVFDIIGAYPTLIRPSYGTYNNRIKKLMDRPMVIWNVDTLDWKSHNSNQIAKRIFKSVSDGDIILMHDIYSATANSLEIIIPKLLEDGYQFVTVSDLLYYKNIEIKKGQVYSNAN